MDVPDHVHLGRLSRQVQGQVHDDASWVCIHPGAAWGPRRHRVGVHSDAGVRLQLGIQWRWYWVTPEIWSILCWATCRRMVLSNPSIQTSQNHHIQNPNTQNIRTANTQNTHNSHKQQIKNTENKQIKQSNHQNNKSTTQHIKNPKTQKHENPKTSKTRKTETSKHQNTEKHKNQ